MNKPDYKKIRDAVFALCERNAREVAQLYDNAITEIAELMKGIELDETRPFSFEDYGLQDKVDEIMDRLEVSISNKVRDGVIAAYGMSYANCEALVKYAVGEHVAAKVKKAFLPKIRSRDAAIAFLKNVPTASGRLWNGETLALMTSAVEDSIRQGMSAGKMATQIKKYLLDPDDWHRRFRYKVGEDEEGNPIYGRKWKKREFDETTGKYHWVDHQPGEPHPGHVGGPGAYRSSYKNALRYARTTTNMAYRTADYNQYQDMPFVIGIEIKLSNNHPVPDICDDLAGVYPADFLWTGWHPNCRCYMVPVLAKKNEIDKMVDAILNDEDPNEVECEGVVTELPENFTAWAVKNKDRMEAAAERGTLPYFIRDNEERVNKAMKTSLFDGKVAGEKNVSFYHSESGGMVITDPQRVELSRRSKQELMKYEKESEMCKVLATNGHVVRHVNDTELSDGSYDAVVDGVKADLKRLSSANNIKREARRATKRQGAEMTIFQFDNDTPQIRNVLAELKRKGFKFMYFFTGSTEIVVVK